MKALLTFIAALAFGASPLATQGFRGFAPDQFPVPQIDPPVQPAGFAFAIWGIIYLWLVLGSGFGVVRRPDDAGWDEMRLPLAASMAIGAVWIPVANASPIAATLLIWLMLVGAVVALVQAGSEDYWWQRAPIGLYAGWLTAASCVSTGLVLAGYGLIEAETAALLGLALALAVSLGVLTLRHDTPTYPVAVIWGVFGILAANVWPPVWSVIAVCLIGIAFLAVRTLLDLRR